MDTKIIKDVEKFENIPELEKAVTFFGSARLKEDNFYYQQAKILAQKCAQNGFCVISGGGGGIMRAANEGAFSQKNNTNLQNTSSEIPKNTKIINNNKTTQTKTYSKNSQEYWPQILGDLKQNGKIVLYTNLMNTQAKEINDMTVGIEFPNGMTPFGKTILEKQENIREISNLVSMACGKPMQIKYIINSSQTKQITNDQTIQNLANESNIPFTME